MMPTSLYQWFTCEAPIQAASRPEDIDSHSQSVPWSTALHHSVWNFLQQGRRLSTTTKQEELTIPFGETILPALLQKSKTEGRSYSEYVILYAYHKSELI